MRSARSGQQEISVRRLPRTYYVTVSALWFALSAQWLTFGPIILPDQIAGILGPDDIAKEGMTGTIGAAGALVALVVSPIAGALSDRSRSASGRRRPFLIVGIIGTCVALALLAPFGLGSSILLYGLAVLNLQFWWNWVAGPYAGLIPDVVPATAQSTASGWMNAMTILGIISGNLIVFECYANGDILPVLLIFIALNLICLAVTLVGVREPPADRPPQRFDLRAFVRSFYVDPRTYPSFYWVLATRLMSNMGIWSVFAFMLFYLEDVVGLGREGAARLFPVLLGGGAVIAIPASLLGVWMADRHGIVNVVRITSWVMAATALGYVLIALHPALALVVPAVLVFSAANGAYGAVDWALALKVLPAGQDAGKDMGIWNVCMVLPQILGPAAIGWLITGIKAASSGRLAYEVAFAISALWFTLAALLIVRVRLGGPAAEGLAAMPP